MDIGSVGLSSKYYWIDCSSYSKVSNRKKKCVFLFPIWFFIIDTHRTTLNNMKHQGIFKINSRITHRTWIFCVLIVCIQQKHCSAGGRSYTESEIAWGEKSYIVQMNCSDCLLSRSSWYWSPKNSSFQLHVSSGWHLFFIGLFSTFGPVLGNERMENTLVFWELTSLQLTDVHGSPLVLTDVKLWYCIAWVTSVQSANASLSLRTVPETVLHWIENKDWISNSRQ